MSCLTNKSKDIQIACFILPDTPYDIITSQQSIIENNLALRSPEHFFSRIHLKGPGNLQPNERKAIYDRLLLTDDISSYSNGVVVKPSVPDETQVDILRPASLDTKRTDRIRSSSNEPLTKKRRRAPLRTVSVPLESNDRSLLGISGTWDVVCQ